MQSQRRLQSRGRAKAALALIGLALCLPAILPGAGATDEGSASDADLMAPALVVLAPSNGATVGVASVQVAGTTEPGAAVSANGVVLRVLNNGSFLGVVPLVAGANSIVVEARDAAGNSVQSAFVVHFVDPLPAMRAELEQALLELSEARTALEDAQLQLALLWGTSTGGVINQSAWSGAITAASDRSAEAEAALVDAQHQAAAVAGYLASVEELRAEGAPTVHGAEALWATLNDTEAALNRLNFEAAATRTQLALAERERDAVLARANVSWASAQEAAARADRAEARAAAAEASASVDRGRAFAMACGLAAVAGAAIVFGFKLRAARMDEKSRALWDSAQ